ncbi:MBL fold metallo-hydrolase [Phaeocystidibacter luteus]|uniref:Metallo-beta-lactamase domain-containing protein n=1 Tax=Phaeocystidibacter luteus TaxID=911197 RepID=A0A6N6RE27_9FLAO|nr:MBL fold metallo-hydrolase [Phaeocystidibacter luteus]KAB2807741.1 hypothetical protein F8C67_11920 [Phaeocystidibacter luteus]
MRRVWKFLKRTFLVLVSLLILFTIAVFVFVGTAPQIGESPSGADLERIEASPNYGDGEFINLIPTALGSFGEMMGTLPDAIWGENLAPDSVLPVKFGEAGNQTIDTLTYITWYGHSAFLIETSGYRILIDPMLGEYSAPVSFGTQRYPYEEPIPIEELTDIDILILSHDHYDHLDYATVIQLKDEVAHFYTALGVGSHLKSWDIPEEKITELDWWESNKVGEVELIATPARHFSGRGILDRNKTQWASWVIRTADVNLYFSGDGGYGPHFEEIGNQYGPFDLAMLECGQYNEAWSQIHMMPEESVLAGLDVRADLIMPIHWGAFALSVHEWTDPILRFKAESGRRGLPMVHPYIGERFVLGIDFPREEWWLE